MQLALLEVQRRVQARVPLPWLQPDPAWLAAQQLAGHPVVRFGDIPLDWTDLRLTLRQTADVLHRLDTLERAEHQRILALSRDGNALERIVTDWYLETSGVDGSETQKRASTTPPSLDQVLVLSLRPFLTRSRRRVAAARRSFGVAARPLSVLRLGT